MIVITNADMVARTDTSNTLRFDNVRNQLPDANRSFVLELTSQTTGDSISVRLTPTVMNTRFMKTVLLMKGSPGAADPAGGSISMGLPSLPYGFYDYKLAHQVGSSINTSISNATIFQYGLAVLIDKQGVNEELSDSYQEYEDANTYDAYEN